jgi:cysteine-rich repeat protein
MCVCLQGKLAGQLCTTIAGCTSVIKPGGVETCLICNRANKFQLVGGTCVCQKYHELVQDSCKDICGDGKLFSLACDDGNKISGDGCSSTCKVEYRYICEGSPNNGPSKCIYQGNIKLALDCIYKSEVKNTV